MTIKRDAESAIDTGVDHTKEMTLSSGELDLKIATSIAGNSFVRAVEEDVGSDGTCTTIGEGVLSELINLR